MSGGSGGVGEKAGEEGVLKLRILGFEATYNTFQVYARSSSLKTAQIFNVKLIKIYLMRSDWDKLKADTKYPYLEMTMEAKQMRILDIDLDFFLKEMSSYGYVCEATWNEDAVIKFLENKCKLLKDNKIKGEIVNFHHGAFYYWRDLIYNGQIRTPFEVVHVDAHADLGLGDAGWVPLVGDILHYPIQDRVYKCEEHLEEGNYLAFAIACQWIHKIEYVTHPEWDPNNHDLPYQHFKDFDTNGNNLTVQLKKYDRGILDDEFGYLEIIKKKVLPLGYEPEVIFKIIPCESYENSSAFSFINLSISPNYAPRTAKETIVPVIKEYIDCEFGSFPEVI